MESVIQTWANVAMSIFALIALIVAYVEYKSHNKTDEHKLFSQLNRRYQENNDIQYVVKYLRDKEPSEQEPSLYQLELFLRFFEELGMYMSTNSLDAGNADVFFGFYLRQLYRTHRGKELLARLNGDDSQLEYLNTLKRKIHIEQ